MKNWILNVIVAAIAALFSVLQELWLGTELTFLRAFVYATLIGVCLSWGTEVVKSIMYYRSFSWVHVSYGAYAALLVAITGALAIYG